jgi:CRP/FNR family transcriptional regulator, cyclic AMP receptor protein
MRVAMVDSSKAFGQNVQDALNLSIIASFPPSAIDKMFSDALLINVPSGSILYREYDPSRMGLVVGGLIREYRVFPDGRNVTFGYHRAGDVLGIPLTILGPLQVNGHAMVESSLLLFNPATFKTLLKTEVAVCWITVEYVCREFNRVVDELTGNIYGSASERIARHLLELAARSKDNQIPMAKATHQEIADSIGVTRETVSRVIHQLELDKTLRSSRGYVIIDDLQGLHSLAQHKHIIDKSVRQ